MTVPVETFYTTARGNGVTTVFPYTFRIPEASMARVWLRNWTTKAVTAVLLAGTDYTITGTTVANEAGGNVTLIGAPIASTVEVVIFRSVPYTQDLDLLNQGGYFPNSLEYQLDKLVFQMIQLSEAVGRSLRAPFTETLGDLPSLVSRKNAGAGSALGFDGITGAPILIDTTSFKGDPGDPGVGTPGTNGNTVLHGSGVPSAGLGVNGDWYIDTSVAGYAIYGPKSAGAWGSGTPWRGPAGLSGTGTGDMLAAQNGADFANVGTVLTNLGFSAFIKTLIDDASAAAALTTLGAQPLDAELTAIAGLTSAAAKGIQFTGSGTAGTYDLTAFAKTFLDDADSAAVRATLGILSAGILAEMTTAEYLANTAARAVSTDKLWAAGALVALTDAATIAVDMSTFINGSVTLAGNRTLGNPSATKVGQSGSIRLTQDGTGTRTLAYASNWKFAGGTAPVLSTTAGAVDILEYKVISSTFIWAALIKDVK